MLPAFIYWNSQLSRGKGWMNLFRVILIFKYQLYPFLIIFLLGAKRFGIDILLELFIPFACFSIISSLSIAPYLTRITKWSRFKWIITNIISFIFWYAILFGITSSIPVKIDSNSKSIFALYQKTFSKISPLTEISHFNYFESQKSWESIHENQYLLLLKYKNDSLFVFKRAQFLTHELKLVMIKKAMFDNYKNLLTLDSIKRANDPSYRTSPIEKPPNIEENYISPNMKTIDSFWLKFNDEFYNDIRLTQNIKDSAKFSFSQNYFKVLHEYLVTYDSIFKNDLPQLPIIDKLSDSELVINLEDGNFGILKDYDGLKNSEIKSSYKTHTNNINKYEKFLDILILTIVVVSTLYYTVMGRS
ncbi:hypothetical protein [Zobellia amurskyensis]|nr:hypothetical protein [Zobellia amurskyensis]